MPQSDVYRILDANLNRLREGLRVVEEYYRFVSEDLDRSQRVKNLRHEVTSIMNDSSEKLSSEKLLEARDVTHDGLALDYSESEGARRSVEDVMQANMQRVKEALRALEEYGKIIDPKLGEEFQRIRFKTYELESFEVDLKNNTN